MISKNRLNFNFHYFNLSYYIYYFIWLTLILFIFYPFNSYSKNNQCINYMGGVGEFEVNADYISLNKIFNNDLNYYNLPIPNCNYDFRRNGGKLAIDRKVKFRGDGSLKIELERNDTSHSDSMFFQCINFFNALPDRDYSDIIRITTTTRNYYPNVGDRIEVKFKIKPELLQNIKVNYMLGYSTHSLYATSRYIFPINIDIATPGSPNTWLNINYSINVPYHPDWEIRYLNSLIHLIPINLNQPSKATIYIDDLEIYAYRNNQCISWPERNRKSSLKFFDLFTYKPSFGNGSDFDFIAMYLENDAWLGGNIASILKIQSYDKNFKNFPYISLLTLHRYIYPHNLKPRRFGGEFNNYLDDLNVNTTSFNNRNIIGRIHPNARYPDYFLLNKENLNMYHPSETADEYVFIKTILNEKIVDYFTKSLRDIIKFSYGNSIYRPDTIYFDNYGISPIRFDSRQYPNHYLATFYFSFLNKYLYEKISPYLKIFGNWGYNPYIDENEQPRPGWWGNNYSVKNFVYGYLDEGWLLRPEPNLNYAGPQTAHKIFKTAIENKKYETILIIGAYFYPYCTSSYNTTTFMISSFYLVNNTNTYFALRPVGNISGYENAQCYDNSMYLPLGYSEEVDNINQLVIASTTNYQNGALYRRRYEKGLVLLNTSNNLTFNYFLSSTTEPYTFYKDHLGNVYNFSTSSLNLSIPPRIGLILYNNE